jgi:hypothetical protein
MHAGCMFLSADPLDARQYVSSTRLGQSQQINLGICKAKAPHSKQATAAHTSFLSKQLPKSPSSTNGMKEQLVEAHRTDHIRLTNMHSCKAAALVVPAVRPAQTAAVPCWLLCAGCRCTTASLTA